jgi:hypothetical protein
MEQNYRIYIYIYIIVYFVYLLLPPLIDFAETNSSTISEHKDDDDALTTFTSNTKQLSMWQQQKILFLRALIYIKRDIVSGTLENNI